MTITTADVAERVRASYADVTWPDVLHELAADKIELRHDPLVPEFDGMWEKAKLLDHNDKEAAAWKRAMPDLAYDGLDVAVDEDDSFVVTFALSGTLPSGKQVRVPARLRYFVADGAIVGMEAWVDPTTIADLGEAMVVGGYTEAPSRD